MAGSRRRLIWIYCSIFASLSGILAGYGLAYRWEDAYWYYQIADGKTNLVIHPFSVRQLAPLAARLLHTVTPLDLNHSFAAIGVASIVAFAGMCFWLLQAERVPFYWMLTVAGLSFWAISFSNYMLPDLLNDVLLLLFIIALMKEYYLWASFILLPLAVSRESALLVLIAFLAASFTRVGWPILLTSIGSTFAGLQTAKHLAASSLGNRHGLGDMAYTLLKMPFNFVVNVLGVDPWLNTLTTHCATPIQSISLPFHVGAIRVIGYCGFGFLGPLTFLASWFCEFAPLLVAVTFLFIYRRARFFEQPPYLRFCLLYGGACFVLAPFLGAAVDRLVSYSWPLFLVAAPVLCSKAIKLISMPCKVALCGFGILTSWSFYILGCILHSQAGLFLLLIGTLAGGLYFWSACFTPSQPRPTAFPGVT